MHIDFENLFKFAATFSPCNWQSVMEPLGIDGSVNLNCYCKHNAYVVSVDKPKHIYLLYKYY